MPIRETDDIVSNKCKLGNFTSALEALCPFSLSRIFQLDVYYQPGLPYRFSETSYDEQKLSPHGNKRR